jgi:hypothetical protein
MNEKSRANGPPAGQLSKGAKRKAAKMAGREIDRLGDQTATREEQHDESAGSSKARENFAIFVKTKAEIKTLNKRIRPGDP